MGDLLVVDRRFCGPPDSGNGGYVCGVVAALLDGPAQVTLRRPPPLGKPLTVTHDGPDSVRVEHDGALVAEGVRMAAGIRVTDGPGGTSQVGWTDGAAGTDTASGTSKAGEPGGLVVDPPGPVTVGEARQASAGSWLRTSPQRHPFPMCFVCGPQRPDGLRIAPGQVPERNLSADVWSPDPSLAGPDGQVRPEFLWAALDCTGGIGAFGDDPDGPPYLLGRFAVRQLRPIRPGQPHVVTGWRLSREGRKMLAGSALLTADGQPAGIGLATWIQLA